MYDYEHTQPGTALIAICGSIGLVLMGAAGNMVFKGAELTEVIGLMVPVVIMAVVLVLFHSLTVRISRHEMEIAFGIGVPTFRVAVDEIVSAFPVRNGWYHGWGIKRFAGGWLYNVSGLDAVEIHLENGKKLRIGTDEPQQLLAAIQQAAPKLRAFDS